MKFLLLAIGVWESYHFKAGLLDEDADGGEKMAELARIDTLKHQHSQLESKIEFESRRPQPDELLVTKLKREKLKVKDELAQLHAL